MEREEAEVREEAMEEPGGTDAPLADAQLADPSYTDSSKPSTDGAITETIHWDAPNFLRMRESEHSEVYTACGHPWRFLIFPRGNRPNELPTHIALFLDAFSEGDLSPGWVRRAKFVLRIVNPHDSSKSVEKHTSHVFTSEECDWGFNQFVTRNQVLDEANGFLGENETLYIECDITMQDSDVNELRKETGYTGLKNQGATCYMNSLLQTLFLLPFFRKAVYHLPTTEMDEANSSIPLALQSLFYKLQVSESSVPTRELIRSFGWDTSDMFIQHDVEELNRILFDKLDERMKSTPVEGSIQKIFGGMMVNYIECLDVDYKSRSKDTFLDLQLDVKGCRNIYDSLDQYVAEDKLEGDNKYYADGYGYTDAKMGTVFEKFPPVLELHLKRFEFDFDRGINVKINSYHEFYDVLDLDVDNGKYIAPTADKSVRNRYILHSVLVHSGGGHGGHYYAFIRPEMHEEGEWFKFDDERVTKESKETAIQQQYGTDEDAMATGGTLAQRMSRVSNAYMLVYVREGDRDMIRATVSDDDIAEHIRYKHEQEKKDRERIKKEKQEAKSKHLLKIVSEEDMRQQVGNTCAFDLVDFDAISGYKIKNDSPFKTVKEEVAYSTGIPIERQRYWTFARRENQTIRPSEMLTKRDEVEAVRNLKKDSAQKNPLHPPEVKLFVEDVDEEHAQPDQPSSRSDMLLFLKVYMPHRPSGTQNLRYGGKLHVKRRARISDYMDDLSMIASFNRDDIALKEEIKFASRVLCETLSPDTTFEDSNLENGDIICIQQKSVEDTEEDVKHYLEREKQRVPVMVRPLNADQTMQAPPPIDFHVNHTYDDVTHYVASNIENVKSGDNIQLYTLQMNQQVRPIPYREFTHLHELVGSANRRGYHFFYEVLSIPLHELEKLKILPVCYFNRNLEEKAVREYRLDRTLKVPDLLEEAGKDLQLSGPLRLMCISQNRIYKVYTNETLEEVDTMYGYLRLEEKEEVEDDDDDGRFVNVYFARRNDEGNSVVQYFGEPFILKLAPTEELLSVRRRVQDKLRVSDNDIKDWKFFSIMNNEISDLRADSVVAERFTVQGNRLTAWDNPLCIALPRGPVPSTRADTHPGQAKQLRMS